MKIIAIVGSPRPTGNTNYLVDQALQEAAACGLETEKIMLSQYRVNPCLGHSNCASFTACTQDDDAPWILDKFSQAEGVILASPVYYFNMTAQMKAFVDRSSFLVEHKIPLRASCAGLVATAGGGGGDQTVRALRRFLKLQGWRVPPVIPDDRIITVTGYVHVHRSQPGVIKNQPALIEQARNLGRRMAEILTSSSKAGAA